MRREIGFALLALLAASLARGDQSTSPTQHPSTALQSSAATVYYAGPGVTAPELIPFNPPTASVRHCLKRDGAVTLSAVIDADGSPRDLSLLSVYDVDLGKMAFSLAAGERFKPGMHNGTPAAVGIEMEIDLQTCLKPARRDDDSGTNQLTLRSQPAQSLRVRSDPSKAAAAQGPYGAANLYKIGGPISAPVPLRTPNAIYSDYGRKKRIQGACLISLIVDAQGMPQHISVAKSLEPSLDQNAMYAVSQYRFKPAMKNGTTPVPVMITVEVDFRFY